MNGKRIVGSVLLGLSLASPSIAAPVEPKGYAKLPVKFSPSASIPVSIVQQGKKVQAKLPGGKTQDLGDLPDLETVGIVPESLLLQSDFNFDGLGDVAVLDGIGYGGVNLFYRLYTWNKAVGKFKEFKETISNPMLDAKAKTINTSQRSGPRWYSKDYRIFNGKPYLWQDGVMVGSEGDLYFVKTYDSAGKMLKKVVVEAAATPVNETTVPAIRKIAAGKAVLYAKPDAKAKTKMYVIKGDKVTLLDYAENDDGSEWFLVRFKGKKTVEQWVKADVIAAAVS
jgi:hypothetical protein